MPLLIVGTVAEMRVAELTVKPADTVPSLTEVAPVKFVPLIVTLVPVNPKVGEKLVIVGALPPPPPPPVTVNDVALVPVPLPFDTA